MAIDYTAPKTPDYTSSNPKSESSSDIGVTAQQLNNLRQTLQATTLTHFHRQLSATLPTEQVNRILSHPNVNLELNKLIKKTTLSPQQDLNSLSFQIAKGLTQISEPHVHMAVALSTIDPNSPKPEDVLQQVLRSSNQVLSSFNPIKDKLKPISLNSSISKVRQQIESSLVVDNKHVPTLKPEVDKIVALGTTESDSSKQQQIANNLHQDLLAEILVDPEPSSANTAQTVDTYLHKHGINTNKIDHQSFHNFIRYINNYTEIVSLNPQVEALQIVAKTTKLTAQELQTILQQTGQTPEEILQSLQTTPIPKKSPSSPVVDLYLNRSNIDKSIQKADQYDYSSVFQNQAQSFPLKDIILFVRQSHNQAGKNLFSSFQTGSKGFFNNVRYILSRSSGLPRSLGGGGGFGPSLGNFAKRGASQAGQALGSAAKTGAKAAAKAAIQAAKAAVSAAGKAASQFAAKALILNPYFWGAILLLIFIGGVWYTIAGASPQKIALMQTDSISGVSGGGLVVENPYIGGAKTATPTKLDKPTGSITYSYTINPTQGELTNISISDEITIIQEIGTQQQNLNAPIPPDTLSTTWTSDPFSFSLNNSMADAAIVNKITIQATAADGTSQVTSFSVTTIIGNPPTGCFVFAEPPAPEPAVTAISWSSAPDALSKETSAVAAIIGSLGSNSSILCTGPINLYLATAGLDVNYGGWYLGNGNIALDYKFGSVGSANNALYTLAHETGHAYDSRTGISGSSFRQSGLVSWSGSSCVGNIYPFVVYLTFDSACYAENFAEGFARYINPQAVGSLPPDWQSWFANNVFN